MAKSLSVGEKVRIRAKYLGVLRKIYEIADDDVFVVGLVISNYGGGTRRAIRLDRPRRIGDPEGALSLPKEHGAEQATQFCFCWPVMLERTEEATAALRTARAAQRLAADLDAAPKLVEGLVAIRSEAGKQAHRTRGKKKAAIAEAVWKRALDDGTIQEGRPGPDGNIVPIPPDAA